MLSTDPATKVFVHVTFAFHATMLRGRDYLEQVFLAFSAIFIEKIIAIPAGGG